MLIPGAFLYHAVSPCRAGADWHITNPEQSVLLTVLLGWMWPWALRLFFLVAGATSLFSLRGRIYRHHVSEQVARKLIPFIVGSVLLLPPQTYHEYSHKGSSQGSFLGYFPPMLADNTSGNLFTRRVCTEWGFRLWFFAFAPVLLSSIVEIAIVLPLAGVPYNLLVTISSKRRI
jgi:hypothetical protein